MHPFRPHPANQFLQSDSLVHQKPWRRELLRSKKQLRERAQPQPPKSPPPIQSRRPLPPWMLPIA
jgi:hypothetical protein